MKCAPYDHQCAQAVQPLPDVDGSAAEEDQLAVCSLCLTLPLSRVPVEHRQQKAQAQIGPWQEVQELDLRSCGDNLQHDDGAVPARQLLSNHSAKSHSEPEECTAVAIRFVAKGCSSTAATLL